MIKVLMYRYFLKTEEELTYKHFWFELFVNLVVFSLLNMTGTEYYVCYLVDTLVVSVLTQTYLKVCKKEEWEADPNKLSGIVLVPYYVVLC